MFLPTSIGTFFVTSESIDLFISLIWELFSSLFGCLVIFDQIPGTLNFIMVRARYSYIPKNILKLCAETQVSYLEIVLFF